MPDAPQTTPAERMPWAPAAEYVLTVGTPLTHSLLLVLAMSPQRGARACQPTWPKICTSRRFVFQGVHMLLDAREDRPWGAEARASDLIFIGRKLDRAALTQAFQRCAVR